MELVSIAPEQAEYRVGDAVWITLGVRGPASIALDRLQVRVLDPDAELAPVVRRKPPGGWGCDCLELPGSGAVAIDAARYGRIDRPGTWTVRVLWPYDETGVAPADDPRWLSTTVEIAAPDDLAAVALAHPLNREVQAAELRWVDRHDRYDALGHAAFVPVLEPLAARSVPVDPGSADRVDRRALGGLFACPCVEATEALFRLYDGFGPQLRALVADELLVRRPRAGPATHPFLIDHAWFAARAWDERFDAELLARARVALPDGDSLALRWAADVIELLGGPEDVPALAAALDRVGPADRATIDLKATLRSIEGAPAPPGASPGTRLIVAASGHLSDADLLDALRSGDLWFVVWPALQHLDRVPKPEAAAWVGLHLGSPERRIAEAAYDAVLRHPDPIWRDALLERLDHAEPAMLRRAWDAAAAAGIPPEERAARVSARSDADLPDVHALLAGD